MTELCPFMSQNERAPVAIEAWTVTVTTPIAALCPMAKTPFCGRHSWQTPGIVGHHPHVGLGLLHVGWSRHLLNGLHCLWHRVNTILIIFENSQRICVNLVSAVVAVSRRTISDQSNWISV